MSRATSKRLTYAGLLYFDRTLALATGACGPADVALDYEVFDVPGPLFRRQARHAEFEISEMSLSTLIALHSRGDRRFVAIPVFPSRNFRHSEIYVHADGRVEEPRDLVGKNVGILEYQMTAALWIRALLDDDHGVAPSDVTWWAGGLRQPGYEPRVALDLPPEITVRTIPDDRWLEEMLEAGDIDALVTVQPPQRYGEAGVPIRRLFQDYVAAEVDYYRRTGFFPIMHTVVLRRDVHEEHPGLAAELVEAFEEAKRVGAERLRATTGLAVSLPWLKRHLEEVDEVLGADPFVYGFEPNLAILRYMVDIAHRHGLATRSFDPAELFAPECLEREAR